MPHELMKFNTLDWYMETEPFVELNYGVLKVYAPGAKNIVEAQVKGAKAEILFGKELSKDDLKRSDSYLKHGKYCKAKTEKHLLAMLLKGWLRYIVDDKEIWVICFITIPEIVGCAVLAFSIFVVAWILKGIKYYIDLFVCY